MGDQVKASFHTADYVICVAIISISLGVGVFHAFTGGKQRTTGEYLLGNRRMRLIPVALSLLVSYLSAVTILGTGAEMYLPGTQFWLYVTGFLLSALLVIFITIPVLYPLQLISLFEFHELRYQSKIVRLLGSIGYLVQKLLMDGVVLVAPALALEAVSTIPVWASIITIGVVSTVYTTMGGLKAVVWTDVFQALVILSGLLAVVIQGTIKVGGVAKVWHLNEIGGRIRFFDFDPDPTKRTTFWSMLIGFCFYYFFVYSGQTAAQRYCSLPTMRLAKLALLINVPGLFLLGSLSCAAGVVAFAYYSSEHCDPLKQGNIDNSNQIIPYFVMDVLGYPGFPGVFVACLLCGTLSTVSSSLNTMAALVWEDMLKSFFTDINEGKSANITKIIAAVGGCLTIGMGFVMAHARGTLIQTASTVLHIPGTATLGLLFMGALFPRFSWKGACISYLCTVGVCLWLAIGALQSGIHKESLPTSVDGCFGNMTFIYSANTTFLSPKQETVSYNDATLNGTKSINKSNIPIVYQITSFWFPLIGLLVFVVIGTITCFIPGIRETRRIEDQFLHPYVVWLRNRANKKGRRRVRTTDVGMTGPGESIAMAYRNDEPIYHPVATKADLHVDHIGAS